MCGKNCTCKKDFDKAADNNKDGTPPAAPAPEGNDNAPAGETPKKKKCGGDCHTKKPKQP